jgi:hypothetical protein
MFSDGFEQEMMFHAHNQNLSHHKVPDENLTPEQLKKREESLTNLRKIQQMLFPEQRGGHQGFGPMPGQGPGPGRESCSAYFEDQVPYPVDLGPLCAASSYSVGPQACALLVMPPS